MNTPWKGLSLWNLAALDPTLPAHSLPGHRDKPGLISSPQRLGEAGVLWPHCTAGEGEAGESPALGNTAGVSPARVMPSLSVRPTAVASGQGRPAVGLGFSICNVRTTEAPIQVYWEHLIP